MKPLLIVDYCNAILNKYSSSTVLYALSNTLITFSALFFAQALSMSSIKFTFFLPKLPDFCIILIIYWLITTPERFLFIPTILIGWLKDKLYISDFNFWTLYYFLIFIIIKVSYHILSKQSFSLLWLQITLTLWLASSLSYLINYSSIIIPTDLIAALYSSMIIYPLCHWVLNILTSIKK